MQLQKRLAGLKLLIIDELGFVPLSKIGAELLFEVFSQRYERGSTPVTSDLPSTSGVRSLAHNASPECSWTAVRTVGLDQATIRISGD